MNFWIIVLATIAQIGAACPFDKLAPLRDLTFETKWEDVIAYFTEQRLPPVPLTDVAPARDRDVRAPFGKFKYRDTEYDYSAISPAAKSLPNGTSVYFGKPAVTRAEAEGLVRRYFTKGVHRSGGHFDVFRHQATTEGSLNSGFSIGTEHYGIARNFARRGRVSAGVIFVCDTTGQEVLNVEAFRKLIGQDSIFSTEGELLTKGGRDPRTIRAAIVYERGRAVAFYTNPNFQERTQ